MSVKPVVRSAGIAASWRQAAGSSMSVSRLFVETDLSAGAEAPLDEAQAHYLRNVMRAGEGARLLLFNGRDGEWQASLSLRGKKVAVAEIATQTRKQESEP